MTFLDGHRPFSVEIPGEQASVGGDMCRWLLDDSLNDEKLFVITMIYDHYKYIIHLLSMGYPPEGFSTAQKKQLVVHATYFQLIVG